MRRRKSPGQAPVRMLALASAWTFAMAMALLSVSGMATAPAAAGAPPDTGFDPAPGTPAAAGKRFAWEQFDVALILREDLGVDVIQVQRVRFSGGPFRTGFAEIPVQEGQRIDEVRVGELVDGALVPYARVEPEDFGGQPGTFAARDAGGLLRMDWAMTPATDATRTFMLGYHLHGAARTVRMGDYEAAELSWTVIDEQVTTAAPVEAASLTVVTPAAWPWVAMKLQTSVFPEATTPTPRNVVMTAGPIAAGRSWRVTIGVPIRKVGALEP
ncbi:MAG: hypothetical protein ACKOWF_16880 [Chloroflexota bacterium]